MSPAARTGVDARISAAIQWIKSLPAIGDSRELRLDSREVRPGDIFVAVPGAKVDGRHFVGDAAIHGASGAVVDDDGWSSEGCAIPVAPIAGLRDCLGALAAEYYGRPSERLASIGVTGTNGKTSCSHWIAQLLTREGRRCAVIGTVGAGFTNALHTSELTTPDPISLQRELRHLLDAGAQALAMEVSSIGLDQGRVDGMHFDVALFTNLTRDHLDYHRTMADYEAAKALLFDWRGLAHAVFNLDDESGCRFAARAAARGVTVVGYSARADARPRPMAPRLLAHDVRATASGLAFELEADGVRRRVEVPLVGQFNVANLLGVVGVSLACGVALDAAVAALAELVPPPGRMQRVAPDADPLIVVDYAHTPDALGQALQALRPLADARAGRLWVVFGAGGDRDPGKRAPMGAAAVQGADVVIITSDNPRGEEPSAIVEQVAAGARGKGDLHRIVDRRDAIEHAVRAAAAADVVLVAGKGHEEYQIVGDERRPFSDVDHARRALTLRGGDRR